jgi:hypothetical protein
MRILFVIIISLFLNSKLLGQTDSTEEVEETPIPWVKASEEGKYRLGIKMGFNLTAIYGSYPIDKGLRLGVLGGGFGRLNFNKSLCLQHELIISFRGGNFNGISPDIGAIKFLYLDVPVIFLVKPNPKSQHRFGGGLQFSHALNKLVFQDNNTFPSEGNIPLENNDWAVVTAYQYQLDYIAFQFSLKAGLRNLNLGSDWPGSSGTIINNKLGSLHNFALEFNLLF